MPALTGVFQRPLGKPLRKAVGRRLSAAVNRVLGLVDLTEWSGWGSSSMGLLSTNMAQLAGAYDATWLNSGQAGELASHTFARLGSRPALLTVTGGSIPTSGAVTVTASNMPADADLKVYTGTLAGIPGTLSSTATTLTFTRTATGNATPVVAGTPLVSTLGAEHRDGVVYLWAGKNDLTGGAVGSVIAQRTIDARNWLSPTDKRCIALGHFVDTNTAGVSAVRNEILACNAAMATAFGDAYVDVRAYVTGSQIWTDLGITPTQTDLDQQALGNLPPSASSSTIHLSPAANLALKDKVIAPRLVSLGWFPEIVAPTVFDPVQLFANGELGTLQYPEIGMLSLEDSGTDPVTAPGQQIGSMISQLAVEGAELCPSLMDPSWIRTAGVTQVDGLLRLTSVANSTTNRVPVVVPVATGIPTYRLRLSMANRVSGRVRSYLYGTANFQASSYLEANGQITRDITLAAGGSYDEVISLQLSLGPSTFDITAISVRELFGAHGLQAIETILPTYEVINGIAQIVYAAGDELISAFTAALGSNCTVARAIPGVGAQILTGQTIGTTFTDNVTHAGLVVIGRALTANETSDLTTFLNTRAGV